ncbi:MAG: ATP-binding cassette domain-containing protein [Bacillota bacterium]
MNSFEDAHIYFESVSYKYPNASINAINNINVSIKKGQFVVLMGANGAGKTTFCQLLNGIIPHSVGGMLMGTVKVAGLDTKHHKIAELSQKVGLVLQDPESQLFTGSVKSEVAFGSENLGIPVNELRDRLEWALKVVRLEQFIDRSPSALSGGQKQRLAIASVIAMRPEILVLDEPTSQLDPIGSYEVFTVVKELNQKYGMTIVMATHHSEEIAEFSDRILVFDEGVLVGDGSPKEIFTQKELLLKTWIREPQVSALANYLKQRGIDMPEFPITVEEMEKYILELFQYG